MASFCSRTLIEEIVGSYLICTMAWPCGARCEKHLGETLVQDEYTKNTVNQLRRLCQSEGLRMSGAKPCILARLREHRDRQTAAPQRMNPSRFSITFPEAAGTGCSVALIVGISLLPSTCRSSTLQLQLKWSDGSRYFCYGSTRHGQAIDRSVCKQTGV